MRTETWHKFPGLRVNFDYVAYNVLIWMKKCKKKKKDVSNFFRKQQAFFAAAGKNGHMKKGAKQWLGKYQMKKRLMIPLI
ncbi:hypothetical protein CAY57_09555 [Heyndrickxia coagulans]|nr:hypothetical protein CAY57_09555 [Heyndrickxia coagulans]